MPDSPEVTDLVGPDSRGAPDEPDLAMRPPVTESARPQKLPRKPGGRVTSSSPRIIRRMGIRKVRARRVRRTIRHVDPWSVFKVALPLCACIYLAFVVAFTILLKAIERASLIDKVEDFAVNTLQFETFEIQIETIEKAIIVIGLVMAVVSAAALVLAAVLFNLISDIVGGIRVSVIEEEPAVRASTRSRSLLSRPPARKRVVRKRPAKKRVAVKRPTGTRPTVTTPTATRPTKRPAAQTPAATKGSTDVLDSVVGRPPEPPQSSPGSE